MAVPATATVRVMMAAHPKPQGILSSLLRRSGALLRSRYWWMALLCLPLAASAQQGLPALNSMPAPGGGTNYSLPIQTMLFLTSLSFIPAALLMMTCFTRIVIVLSLLRQALGTQAAPPNQVIVGLSLFLTFFVMSPTLDRVYAEAWPNTTSGSWSRAVAACARTPRSFATVFRRSSSWPASGLSPT